LFEDAIGNEATYYELKPHTMLHMSLPNTEDAHGTRSKRRVVEEAPDLEERELNTRTPYKESWKSKIKKLFCQGVDIKAQNYALHRDNKLIRSQNKKIMRKLGVECASGSEDHLTASYEWKWRYEDFQDDATTSRRQLEEMRRKEARA
jgi:hypothetical protein